MNSKVANLEDWEKRQTHRQIFSLGRVVYYYVYYYYYYTYIINNEFLLSSHYVLSSAKIYKHWFCEGHTHPMRKVLLLSCFTDEDKET